MNSKLLLLASSLFLSSLELSDTKAYEPLIRALLGTASHFCTPVTPNYILQPPVELLASFRTLEVFPRGAPVPWL